jgi:hypothetical protein
MGLDLANNELASSVRAFVPPHLPALHDGVRGGAVHATATVEACGGNC